MEEPHQRLRRAREKAGFDSPKAASDRFGWGEHTYKSHENGNRGIRPDVARKYAQAFSVSPSWILTGEEGRSAPDLASVGTVKLCGEAAGGVWLEGPDEPVDDEHEIPAVPDPRFPHSAQYARKVKGNSVSNRIRDGEYAIFVSYNAHPGGAPVGSLVDVERTRAGLREHTVKVYLGNALGTDSAELRDQTTLKLESDEADTEVRIVGIAIGAFRPL